MFCIKKHIVGMVGSLLLCGHSAAQKPVMQHYGTENGLASNRVYACIQDAKGYMWFATDNGVSRFDGKEFKNFTSNDGLPDNDITDIATDTKGRIWLSCFNGQPCYISGNRVYTMANDRTLAQITGVGHYFKFRPYGKGLIATNMDRHNYEVDARGNISRIAPKNPIYPLGDHVLHAGLNRRFILYDKHYRAVDSMTVPVSHSPIETKKPMIYLLGETRFAIPTQTDICYIYSIRGDKFSPVDSVKSPYPFPAVFQYHGKIWGNDPGVGVVPILDNMQVDTRRRIEFPGKLLLYFFEDREGNLWGCTAGNGIYMKPQGGYSHYNEEDGMYANNVIKLAVYGNDIFLGYDNTTVQCLSKNKIVDIQTGVPPSVYGKISDMYVDDRYIVLGTYSYLIVISRATGRIQSMQTAETTNIKCIAGNKKHELFYGTHRGCLGIKLPNRVEGFVYKGRVTALHCDENGDLLVGTLHGLIRQQMRDGRTYGNPEPFLGTQDFTVSCIANLGNVLVVGTTQKGILLIRGNDHEFVRLSDEMSNVNCKSIFIHGNGIWVASFSGIYNIRLNGGIHNYSVRHLHTGNGLPGNDINDILVMNDTVYAATPDGLLYFPENMGGHKTDKPQTYIHHVQVNGTSFDALPLELPSDSNTVKIHFSGIDFKSLGNMHFKYRLKGMNETWQYTDMNHVIFESLPPGEYTFEVYAMNAQDIWSGQPAVLHFSISPAWWQSTWFKLGTAVLGALLIYVFLNVYLGKKHQKQFREESLKKQMAEMELKAIKAQINPHFIFNTLNAIQYFINNDQNGPAETYLVKLGSLLRNTLEFSNRMVIPLDDEIQYLNNYLQLEKLRFDEHFTFHIHNLLPTGMHATEVPTMVLQPHIENALRHGLRQKKGIEKKVDIRFGMENDALVCEIEDNGIGREAAALQVKSAGISHPSRGVELSNNKLRVYEAITGKKIRTEIIDRYTENMPSGTLVRIIINLQ